jgi:hypothetical protein
MDMGEHRWDAKKENIKLRNINASAPELNVGCSLKKLEI